MLTQETEKAGKERPVDPRFIEDPKKAKKEPPKKKDPKAPEEPVEKELDESPHEKQYDYLYLMLDDFEDEKELAELEDILSIVLLTVRVRNVDDIQKDRVTDPQHILDSQFRESKKFVEDLKKRLDDFVENAEITREAHPEEDAKEREAIESNFYQTFIRNHLSEKNVWSWHALTIEFDAEASKLKDPTVHWAFYLRETIFEITMGDSLEWRSYLEWVGRLNLSKVTTDSPILYTKLKIIEADKEKHRKEKEEQARLAEEEKAKKGAKAPPQKADPKKDLKKPSDKVTLEKLPSRIEDHKKEELKIEEPKAKSRQPMNSEWRLFEVLEKQLKGLSVKCLSPGVFMEAFCDEIQTRATGGISTQLMTVPEEEYDLRGYLDSVFAELLSNK